MVFGTRINGAKLWIEIGGGQTVQLGEVAKVLIVVFLAAYLRDKRELLAIPTAPGDGRAGAARWPPSAPVLLFLVACLALVVILNDFGTALLFLGHLPGDDLPRHRPGGVHGLRARRCSWRGRRSSTRSCRASSTRVDNWLHPFDDAQGQGYQLVQSLYAMAAGRRGRARPRAAASWCARTARTVVPAARRPTSCSRPSPASWATWAAWASCSGSWCSSSAGSSSPPQATDGFSKLLAGGLTAAIGLQAILIIGGVTRLIPLTGVTLPVHELRRAPAS